MAFWERVRETLAKAGKNLAALVPEKKIVNRKGKTFTETFHVKPGKTQAAKKVKAKGLLTVGHEVKYKPAGETYHRTGLVKRVNKDTYTIEGKRNAAGERPTHKIPHAEVIPLADWREYRYQPSSTMDRKKYTTEGDRANANYNLSDEELRRRKKVIEKRLGFSEGRVIVHPSFEGPAVKIVSELAESNGINTAITGKKPGLLWAHAVDQNYQEMLFRYSIAALKTWRRELAKDLTPQIKTNIEQFKAVIAGKRKSSYIHAAMEREGKTAVINFLRERKDQAATHESVDWNASDSTTTPHAQNLLDRSGSQPLQLKYTLAANKEGLRDDMKALLSALSPVDREVLRGKFGMHPYKEPVANNEELADHLNGKGLRNGKYKWDRSSVGQVISGIITKLQSASHDETGLQDKYSNGDGTMKPVAEWSPKDQAEYRRIALAAGLRHHMDELLGRKIYNSESMAGSIKVGHEPEPHGAVRSLSRKEIKKLAPALAPPIRKSLPEDFHPAGDYQAAGITYTVAHEEGQAVLVKAERDGAAIEEPSFDLLFKAIEIESLRSSYPDAQVAETSRGLCLVFPADSRGEELRKSFSRDLAERYPGGRWVTITDESSPMHGRHIYILPHQDGSATVLVGGGPTLRHKVLTLKRQDGGKKEAEGAAAGDGSAPAEKKEGEEAEAKPEEEKPAKETPVLTEDERQQVEDSIKVLSGDIANKRAEMTDFVRQQWGIDRELTPEEKQRIEKRVEHIEDPVHKAVEVMKETARAERSKEDEQLRQIINTAKQALLEDDPTGQGGKGIAAIVKENAETLIGSYMAIKSLEKERKDLRKMIRVGKLHDRFRTGQEIIADFTPLTSDEIRDAVSNEKALHDELAAHYRLVKKVRGVEGVVDTDADKINQGNELERNIKQGGFETLTGVIGQHTKKAIVSKKVYDELGANNAAILARHYLITSGHDPAEVAGQLAEYITAENSPVAHKANDRGKYFMELAKKVRSFGQGADNVMTAAQANGTGLRYLNKAYEAFGQAEGALNQGAEMIYALKGRGGNAIEFASGYTDTLDRKRIALGLGKGDVIIKKEADGGYKMTVPPRSFEKLIKEDDTFAHGRGLGLEHTPEELADGKANTDEFFPTGLNTYTPVDSEGRSEKVAVRPHEQAAARMLAQQKKIYLNFEAGTGKSKTSLLMKAHLDDLHGKQHKMIVAMPDKLVANYADEVRKWTGYEPVIVTGKMSGAKRKKLLAEATGNQVIIVNHDAMRIEKQAIQDAKFDFVVADEAHKSTQREGRGRSLKSEGLFDIAKEAPYYVAMSGTPTPSDLSQLYAHINVMDPEKFGSQKEFMAQFGSVHKGVGYKEAVAQFMSNQLSDRVMTLKKTIDAKLNHHTHRVELSPQQRKAYKGIMEFFGGTDKKQGAILNRDRQLTYLLNGANHDEDYSSEHNNKYKELKKIIDHHLATKSDTEKVGIYAQNNATIKEIQRFLAKHYPQYDHVVFNGETKKSELDGLKAKVTGDPKTKFSLHMKAGVEGLNLQHTDSQHGLTTVAAMASGEDSYSTIDQFFSRGWRTGANRDIDGHTILSDSPHDIATELRLDEKKAVGELVRTDKRTPKAGTHLIRKKPVAIKEAA